MSRVAENLKNSKLFQTLLADPRLKEKSVAFPESLDPRVLEAAAFLLQGRWVKEVVLFASRAEALAIAQKAGVILADLPLLYAEEAFPYIPKDTHNILAERLAAKNLSAAELTALSLSPLYQAGYLLKTSRVDTVIGGCQTPTAAIIRAALYTVGLLQGVKTVSGAFMMEAPLTGAIHLFADAAVVPEPSEDQIFDIARASLVTWQKLLPEVPPALAFLSFATQGSATGPSPKKMAAAARRFKEAYPDVVADGEVQFDAAVNEAIGKRKMTGSLLPGAANIFIFPNLDAGNIAYKLAERWAGYAATGPILMGTKAPYLDLSRGADSLAIAKAALLGCGLSP